MSKHKEWIAFKCLDCGIINVITKYKCDGHRCIECGGIIGPIGEARVYESRNDIMAIGINVDTTQVDIALEKAKELYKIVCDINGMPPLK